MLAPVRRFLPATGPKIVWAVAAAVLLAGCAGLPSPPADLQRAVAITDVDVVDVAGGRLLRDVTVLAVGDRITEVGREVRLPAQARRLDGSGKFLIPGLWDMHVHHQGTGEESLPLFVANGVVGTRDMGADMDFLRPLRERVNSGAVLSPRIVAGGPMLDSAPEGYPFRLKVTTAGEAVAAVRELAAQGVDFIKVHDNTPRAAYFAAAAEAKRRNLPFAGHVPGSVTLAEAADAGQASIEHLANFRVFIECSGGVTYNAAKCRPLYQHFARGGVWQTPTLVFYSLLPVLATGGPPHPEYVSPSLRELIRRNLEASRLDAAAAAQIAGLMPPALEAVADMHREGVRLLAGCDAMAVPGFCLHDELEWLTRAGLTPAEALRTATLNPAVFLGRAASEGSIEVGKRADLVLLDADPLADIAATRRISAVVIGGRVLERGDLDGVLAAAKKRFAGVGAGAARP